MPPLILKISIALVLLAVLGAEAAFAQQAAPWVTRSSASHTFGDGVGHDEGFTTLEWFLPLEQDSVTEMWFGDFRGNMFDDAEFGGTAGAGYRVYNVDQDRIYGANVYWDFRDESHLMFNQLGAGVETLGEVFDFRVNGYTPAIHDATQQMPYLFSGNNLRNRQYHGLSGIDYEAVANLPDIGDFQARIAGGGYYFDSSETAAANGWRARVEVAFRDIVAASVSVQEDDLFGSTVNVGVELLWQHRHSRSMARRSMDHKFRNRQGGGDGQSVMHRLADPVRRQKNIVLYMTDEAVADTGGTPFTFLHVVEGGTGDGMFETPYGSLMDAMDDALAPTSIVYTPEGGTFTENVTLTAGTRLLSNGPVQTVVSSEGTVQLPFSGVGTDLSSLPATIVDDVELANNTEFSGFNVTGSVSGDALINVDVNNSVVAANATDALTLTNSTDVSVDTVTVSSTTGLGVLLEDVSGTLSMVTVSEAGGDGVEIRSPGTNRAVTFTDLAVTSTAGRGVFVDDASATLSMVSVSETGGDGVEIQSAGIARAVSVTDLTVASTTGRGVFLNDSSATLSTVTVSETGDDGVEIQTAVNDQEVEITGLTVTAAGDEGLDVNVDGTGDLTLSVTDSTIAAANAASSIAISNSGDAFVTMNGNAFTSTHGAGLDADGSGGAGMLYVNGFTSNTVTAANAGGMLFDSVTFNSVESESLAIGSATNRVLWHGLSLTDVSGDWNTGVLTVFNNSGTSLIADNSGSGSSMTLSSLAGSTLDATNGPALELHTIDSELIFDTITSTGSPTLAIGLTEVEGTLTSATTTLSHSVTASIQYDTIPLLDMFTSTLGATTINSAISNVLTDNVLKVNVPGLIETPPAPTINY